MAKTQFLKVKCGDCSSEQVAFSRPSTVVQCLVCGTTLATPTGGEGSFKGEIVGHLS
jgi:small subunit ribosomal protein S27e